ncbi:MAG: DUF4116 domain-containing protein [Treponema sp.]|nr:DUF4116 domain-containing protein [Treponema sp.]
MKNKNSFYLVFLFVLFLLFKNTPYNFAQSFENKDLALLALKQCRSNDVPQLVVTLSPELRADIDFMTIAINKNGIALQYASEELRGNKELALYALENCNATHSIIEVRDLYKTLSQALRADIDIITSAVKLDASVLCNAPDEFRDNKELAMLALNNQYYSPFSCPHGLIYCLSPRLKADVDFMISVINKNISDLQYASDDLHSDINFMTRAVNKSGFAIRYASDDLRDNIDLVTIAINQDASALRFASDDLRGNTDLVKKAINQDPSALRFAHVDLYGNKELVLYTLEKWREWWGKKEFRNYEYENYGMHLNNFRELIETLSPVFGSDIDVMTKIINISDFYFSYASDELRGNFDFVLMAISKEGHNFIYASEELRDNKILALIAFNNINVSNTDIFYKLSPRLRADIDVMTLAAIVNNGAEAFFHSSDDLRGNKTFVMTALKNAFNIYTHDYRVGTIFRLLSTDLRVDTDVMALLLKQSAFVIKYAPEELLESVDFLTTAIMINPEAFCYASPNLQDNEELAKLALRNCYDENFNGDVGASGRIFACISPRLKADIDFITFAINFDISFLSEASEEIRDNKELALSFFEERKQVYLNYGVITQVHFRSLFESFPVLRNDKDVITFCININGYALKYASDDLRNNKELALVALEKIKQDRGWGWIHVKDVVKTLSSFLRSDLDVIVFATGINGFALSYASEELRDNKELAMFALQNCILSEELIDLMDSFSLRLKADIDVIVLAEKMKRVIQ